MNEPARPKVGFGWIVLIVLVAVMIGLLVLSTPEPELKPARTGDLSKVRLLDVDLDGLEKEIKANKGKVVLVDFWATWCGPCRQSFPTVVALHERYAERGLAVISVAFEKDPDGDRERALRDLKEQHAAFTNFLWTERTKRGGEGLQAQYGYPGHIPYSVVFTHAGECIQPPDGVRFSTKELIDTIEKELTKTP